MFANCKGFLLYFEGKLDIELREKWSEFISIPKIESPARPAQNMSKKS